MGFIPQLFESNTDTRGVSPVIGVILMVAITVILAAVVGTMVMGIGDTVQDKSPQASLSVSVNAASDTVEIRHGGGDALHSDRTRIEWDIAGTELTSDPTTTDAVMVSGKKTTFDFNGSATSGAWSEYPSPGTIDITPGDTVSVTVVDVESGRVIFSVELTA